jgi:hypothetical protein
VSVFGTDGIPLSVKASLNDYPRKLFKKDVAVEVEQCKHDGRKFRVTQVFDAVKKPVVIECNFQVQCKSPEDFRRQQAGTERVKFYIGPRYFEHPEMKNVLSRTLGIRSGEFAGARHCDAGLSVICTTDQFARFLIDRNLNGIKNGFMDLAPRLIRTEKPNAYDLLAEVAGITHDQAKKVALALCYSGPKDIMERIKFDPRVVDVSAR